MSTPSPNYAAPMSGAPVTAEGAPGAPGQAGGRRHRGVPVKTLKRMLKKAGLKTSGRKSALTRRAKKAHLMRGGVGEMGAPMGATTEEAAPEGGRVVRRRGRSARSLPRGMFRF